MTDEPIEPDEPDPEVELDRGPGGARLAKAGVVLLAVLVAGLVAVLATSDPSVERAQQSALFGQLAPETAGPTLDGDQVALADFRGRWVVVNFFASWCTPCRLEHPELDAFHKDHQQRGDAALIAVTYDNRSEDARAFFAEHGGGWPVIDDPDNRIGVAWGVAKVPESFVVAPDGTVVHRFAGAVTQASLDEAIATFEQGAEG